MDLQKQRLGWIGLGSIGFPICYGLFKSGYQMVLPTYRRNSEQTHGFSPLAPDAAGKCARIDEMLAGGCLPSESSADLIGKSDIILLCMPTSVQVEQLITGEGGVLQCGRPGMTVIDLTSADPICTQRLNQALEAKGIDLVDACVSGGIAGAIAQTLTIMAGGKREAFDRVRPILETIGSPEKLHYMGGSGTGDTMKCINNFLSALCTAATTEAIMVAARAGIDPAYAAAVISSGSGRNDASMNKYPNLIFPGKDFNFTMELMLKDIYLFTQTAKALEVPAFLANTTAQLWRAAAAESGNKSDCLNLVRMFERWCHVQVVGTGREKQDGNS